MQRFRLLVAALILVAGLGLENRLRASHLLMKVLSKTYRLMTEVRGRLSCAAVASSSAGRIPR